MTASGYTLLSFPPSLSPVDPHQVWADHVIDYAAHPAYADFVHSAGLVTKISTTASFAAKFALLTAKRLIRYEMIPYEFRAARSFSDRVAFVTTGFKNIFGRARSKRAQKGRSALSQHLLDNGIVGVQIPAHRMAELQAQVDPHFKALEERRGCRPNRREFDESRATADPRESAGLFALVNTIFAEAGVFDAARDYIGRNVSLVDVNPQINDPSDTFWLDIFPDEEGQPLPKAAYFHRDASGGDLKVIFYCSDVGPNNGPFTYAIGSNRMSISKMDDLLREANDHSGLSATTPELRRKFASLPMKLRRKGAFGNDLPDDTPLAKAIEQASWEVTAPKGTIVVFDTKGIHRGGMVEQGERRVITCVLG
jgi:hypothetical protein